MNGTLEATRKNEAELFLWVWKDTHECKEDITAYIKGTDTRARLSDGILALLATGCDPGHVHFSVPQFPPL